MYNKNGAITFLDSILYTFVTILKSDIYETPMDILEKSTNLKDKQTDIYDQD